MSTTVSIEDLIKVFNERKRKTMKANPLSIFFLKNGKRIAISMAEKNKRKPEPIEVMNEVKYRWKIAPDNIKVIYVKCAVDLGFEPKQLFANNPEMRVKLDARIANAKSRLDLSNINR